MLYILAQITSTCKTKDCEKPDPVVSKEQSTKKASFPPCGACNSLVNSFLIQTAKSDADFEKVKQKTCNDVSRGPKQCKENLVKWSQHLEKWFLESNSTREDLKEWLCVTTLQVCCPENHFGANCTPCDKIGLFVTRVLQFCVLTGKKGAKYYYYNKYI